MKIKLIEYIHVLIAPCLYCGSLLRGRSFLCTSCENVLSNYRTNFLFENKEGPYPVYYYFRWTSGESDLLSQLILSLKGTRSQIQWRYFAELFGMGRMNYEFLPLPILIIPAPSRTGSEDHAYLWAKGLAEIVNGHLLPCLKRTTNKHQRGSNREARKHIQFELDENYSDLLCESSNYLIIFVDDILTTGATAYAAYQALGAPENFEVWVLGFRSLSLAGHP